MPPRERALRQLAAAAGLVGLAALARRAHLDKHTLYSLARGERRACARTIARLAGALSVNEDVVRSALEARP